MEIPPEYGWVLLSAIIMALSCLLIGFIFGGKIRGEVFNEEFMKSNFGEEHKKATGEDIKKGGAPDSGNGYYSRKLSYKDWYTFNNGQRAHMNFLEFIPANLVFLLVSGIKCPKCAAIIGFGITISRFIYAIGYIKKGPNGRLVGALLNDLLTLSQLILSIMACCSLINCCGGKQPSSDL